MNRTVFIGDLSYFCNEIDLMKHMSKAGKIASIEIKKGSCGESLLHGFVKYETEQGAANAVILFNGHKFMGRKCM